MYYRHLATNPACLQKHEQAKADEKAAKERRKQAQEAERQRAREAAVAAAAAAAAASAEAAQEAERHDTSVSVDSNDPYPIEEDEAFFPPPDDECDGDEDNSKTEDKQDGDDDSGEDEDEDSGEDEDEDSADETEDDDSTDENVDHPVRVNARISFPFSVEGKSEKEYFEGTIMSKIGEDTWLVKFDDGDEYDFSTQEARDAIKKYNELQEQGEDGGDKSTHGGDDAQEEADPTDGILHDVCKLIDDVRETSDIFGNPKGCMTAPNQAAAKLIALLQDSNAPLSLYPAIAKWANDLKDDGTFQDGGKIPTREKIVKNLAQRYHMRGCYPTEKELKLPNAGSKVKVSTFSFTDTLKSLLTDPELMKDDNLLFPDSKDPFSAPAKWTDDAASPEYQQQKNRPVGDIVGGRWYARTYHARCDASKKEILCPIIIFVDKTHTDVKGRLTQEPVYYTLGIFNQKTRNNPRAWRPLGLLPNFKTATQDRVSDRKQEDFHYVLSHVLQELKDVQKKEGVSVKFPYGGKEISAVFKVPTACVLGDHEGQNKNCGHKGVRTDRFCRRCDIEKEKSDQPLIGNPVLASDIDRLRRENKREQLKAKGHYMMTEGTAFTGMDFGECDGGGINQYSFADVMHTIKHGLMDHIRLLLFDEYMPDPKEGVKKHVKRLKKSDQDCKGRTDAKEKKEHVIANKLKILLDDIAKYWGQLLGHQSDRTLGKTHFPSGIASGRNSKFTCGEMTSVLLLLTMILASDIGRQFFMTAEDEEVRKAPINDGGMRMRMDSFRTADYIWAFEECIMMCELFASDLMTVEFVETYLRPYIKLVIKRWTKNLPRPKGDGWRMVKFHNLMHFPDILLEMGNSKVTDTETGEHGHIRVKALAQKTQRVLRTFDRQVAIRLYEDWVIIRARDEMRIPKTKDDPKKEKVGVSSPKFVFDAGGQMSAYKKGSSCDFHDTALQGRVSEFIRENVCKRMNMREGETLSYCTEAKVNGVLYRADPVFYTLRGTRRGWHDIAMAINPQRQKQKVPVQLLGFLRFDNLQHPFDIPTDIKKYNRRVDNTTQLAIVHVFESAPKEPFHPTDSSREKEKEKLHRQSRLLSVGKMISDEGTGLPSLFLIRVEDIEETCLAVPDVTAVTVRKGRADHYTYTEGERFIFVKSRSKWAETYKTWITREINEINGR